MITLVDVVDIRTQKYHSIVVVKKNKAKWFVPAETE